MGQKHVAIEMRPRMAFCRTCERAVHTSMFPFISVVQTTMQSNARFLNNYDSCISHIVPEIRFDRAQIPPQAVSGQTPCSRRLDSSTRGPRYATKAPSHYLLHPFRNLASPTSLSRPPGEIVRQLSGVATSCLSAGKSRTKPFQEPVLHW